MALSFQLHSGAAARKSSDRNAPSHAQRDERRNEQKWKVNKLLISTGGRIKVDCWSNNQHKSRLEQYTFQSARQDSPHLAAPRMRQDCDQFLWHCKKKSSVHAAFHSPIEGRKGVGGERAGPGVRLPVQDDTPRSPVNRFIPSTKFGAKSPLPVSTSFNLPFKWIRLSTGSGYELEWEECFWNDSRRCLLLHLGSKYRDYLLEWCSIAHVHSRVESRPCGVAQLWERVMSGSFATARGCAAGSRTEEAWVSHHFCAGYQKVYVPRISALKPNGSITNRDRQSTTHKSDESSKTNIGNEKRPTLHYRLVNS